MTETVSNIERLNAILNSGELLKTIEDIRVLKKNANTTLNAIRDFVDNYQEKQEDPIAVEDIKVEQTVKTEESTKPSKQESVKQESVNEKEERVEEVKAEVTEEKVQPVEVKPAVVRRVYVPDPREKNLKRDKERGEKSFTPGQKPFGLKTGSGFKQAGQKPSGMDGRINIGYTPIPTSAPNDRGSKKKQQYEKPFEEKHVVNKRSLIKAQISMEDYDEDRETVYRKARPVKKQKDEVSESSVIKKAVMTTETIPLKVLSEKIGVPAVQITKILFKENIMKTINDSVDFDTAAFVAAGLGIELELKLEKTAEDVLNENFDVDDGGEKIERPPVVAVMGHVDHGKTSLLDKIRKTNVTEGEAGGITQHIGAYQVTLNGKTITFLDTPGHAAFTAMRLRGAMATDIAIIVIACDDGIMPQTVEAINHAKAAGVTIIVAANKMDKPEANLDRVKTQLTEQGLVPEEWGGDIIVCPVSAKTGQGINELLETINTIAEVKEYKANPNRKAKGVVIEAKLDQNKGPIATVLVQEGTLKVADAIVVGTVTGKIRAMTDDKGRKVTSAGPSMPVSIMGLDEVPNAGDMLYAVDEKLVKQVAEERKAKEKEDRMNASSKMSLDDMFSKIESENIKLLNIIVKADVQGSAEALKQSFEKIEGEVKVKVIHAATGAINETDVMLADSSNAIIIGFNVRPDTNAKKVAEQSGVQVKLYRVIYEAIDDIEKAMKGMLAPKTVETYMGKAEVRETFKISGVGTVAGCYVTEGKIVRNGKLRIYRDDVMICEGDVQQLKRFKDDVKEVQQGFECGISITKFNDIKIGDFIECYVIEEQK